ncbi:MAG TPA: glutathione S-transferase [Gammaproteobacteria bacterium]|nr:glutathione S-transferase [Gammaproteobacteria bacterium]HBX26426.1 glutathione S-transferase [Gammaproteobacteria bacterium]|tara:strand:+ start:526 stop:1131 length:606 start_codon:yes stop_codon:yes gene_type:complete
MKLYSSPPSPFGRKVKITAHVAGVFDKLDVINIDSSTRTATSKNPNPLDKIPALELKSGQLIVDSTVICEYLIKLANRTDLLPECLRIESLTRIALADGITEAALLMVYERRFRKQSQVNADWLHRQNQKVIAGLEWFNNQLTEVSSSPTLDQVGLAVTLGYLDFRFAGEWRAHFTDLALWLTHFEQKVPSFQLTDPQNHP